MRKTALFPLLTLMGAALVVSCSGDRQGNSGFDASTDTDTDADADADADTDTVYDAGPDSGPGASMRGRWAQLLNVSIIQEVGLPAIPDQFVASRNWYLVDITSDGEGNLTAYEQLCALKLKVESCSYVPGNPKSGVSQNFIDHIPVLERHVTVDSDAPGTPWVSDIVYEVRGANLCNGLCDPSTDSTCDPLPANGSASDDDSTSCSGACTNSHCDQDEDGHPGMTNILAGVLDCETYVTQRWWARLNGEIVDEDTIAGSITDTFSEQTVLAATDICGLGSPGTHSEECPQHQYFKMVRLPDNATCEDVMALTDCDEDATTCDTNDVLPLDPNNDLPSDCTGDGCD